MRRQRYVVEVLGTWPRGNVAPGLRETPRVSDYPPSVFDRFGSMIRDSGARDYTTGIIHVRDVREDNHPIRG
jgi:hypothetical protein